MYFGGLLSFVTEDFWVVLCLAAVTEVAGVALFMLGVPRHEGRFRLLTRYLWKTIVLFGGLSASCGAAYFAIHLLAPQIGVAVRYEGVLKAFFVVVAACVYVGFALRHVASWTRLFGDVMAAQRAKTN